MCLWYIWIHLRRWTKAFTKQMLLCICMNSAVSWKQTGLCLVIPVELPLDTTSGNPLMEDTSPFPSYASTCFVSCNSSNWRSLFLDLDCAESVLILMWEQLFIGTTAFHQNDSCGLILLYGNTCLPICI